MTSTFAARLQIENDGTHDPQDTHGRKCVSCVPYDHNDTHGTHTGRVLAVLAVLAVLVLAVCWHTRHTPWCCAASARRPAPCAPGAAPWQRRGRGWQGRAVRATATERQRTIFIFMV